ncbi:N-acetyltransferase family protein [Zhengella sp. ZM62]|uniref:GNAT family N-acetyltransferase n=1 Tax=Zhengella sedimenti TaxID=3390035 RepID=UPI003976E2A8
MTQIAGLTIRPLEAGDEEQWRRLWTAYLDFYETAVSEEVYRSSFERILRGNAGAPGEFRGLLALKDGRPVGLVHFLFHRHGWKIEDVCYLQDLYADPQVRGTGVGRALIEAVYAAADAQGCPAVYWLTQEFNHEARRLYDRVATVTPFIKYAR